MRLIEVGPAQRETEASRASPGARPEQPHRTKPKLVEVGPAQNEPRTPRRRKPKLVPVDGPTEQPPSGGGGVMDTAKRSYADAAGTVGSGVETVGDFLGWQGAQELGRSMQQYWGGVSDEAEAEGGVSVPDTLKGGYADLASGLGSIYKYAGERFGKRGWSDTGESMKAYWDRVAKESPMSETAQVSPYDDPKVLANPNWWIENTTRMAPSFALPAGAGGAGFKIASKALPGLPKIAAAFGAGVGGLFGGGLEGAQTYEEGLEMGQDEPTAARAGEAMALGSSVLNAIPFYKILNPGARGVIRRFMASGISEGITEAAEEPLDAVIQGLVYDKETDWEDVARSALHVMGPAFLMGGMAGAGSPAAQAPETGAPTPEIPPSAPQTPSARPGGELAPGLEQDETALTGQPGEPGAPIEDVSLVGESPEEALADRMAREFPEEALEPGGPGVDAPAPGSVQDESMDLSEPLPTADVVAMAPDEEIVMEGPADPDLADFLERRQQAGMPPQQPQQPATAPEPVPGAPVPPQGQIAPVPETERPAADQPLQAQQADAPEVVQVRDRVKNMTLSDPVQVAMNAVGDEGRTMESLNDLRREVRGADRALMKKYGVKSMEALEDAPLTESERNFLYYDDTAVDMETVDAMRTMIEPVGDLDEAKAELRRVARRLPETSDVDAMSDLDKQAVGRLMFLGSEIQRLGGNAHDVLYDTVLSEAARHRDPEDAAFMARNMAQRLGQFVDLGPQAAVTEQRQPKALTAPEKPATPKKKAKKKAAKQPTESKRETAKKADTKAGRGTAMFSVDTESDAFQRWFGDSKVVDENGEPLVVYHGTTENFEAFDMRKTGLRTKNKYGPGAMFFTDNTRVASDYAAIRSEDIHPADTPNVVPAYLSIQNPMEIDAQGRPWTFVNDMIKGAQKDGHDGVIIFNVRDHASAETSLDVGAINTYVVFDPSQVKSATGNRGTFDPTDPNILRSESAATGGISTEDATNSLRQIVGKKGVHKLFRSGRFNILPDQRALEEVVGERAESGGRVKGMYDPASKKSYLVAGNIRPEELTGVFLHEVGAHYGLPRMIGKGEYFKIKKQLQRLHAQEDPWVVAAYNRVPKNTPQQYWWDEVLAYTVEQNHQMPALRRMWSKMKAFLKELGVLHAMDMSSADMVELVRGAAGHAVRTAPRSSGSTNQDGTQPTMASKRRVNKDKLRNMGMDFENLPGDPEGSQTRATEPVDQEPDTVDTDAAREQLRKRGYEGGPMFSVDSDQQDRGTIAHMITGEEKVTFHPATQQQNKLKRYLKRYFTKEGLLTDEAFARHVESMGIKNEDELVTQFMVDGMVKAARRAYKKPWMKISERDKAQMNEYLAGNNQADVPAAVKRELDNMRTSLDAESGRVQEMLIDEIMYRLHALNPDQRAKAMELIRNRDQELTPESVEGVDPIVVRKLMMYRTIEGNKRQWLNRSYAVFDNDNWIDEVAGDVKERARQYLMQQVEDSPALSQMSDQAKTDYVEGLMNKLLQPRARDLMSFMNSSQLGQKDLSVLKRRKDIAPEIRELMGEYKDPRVNYARSMGKMSYLVANHHFLRSVREDGLGVFLSSRPSGRMSEEITSWDQNQMAPLAGLYAPPEFAAALREAAEPAAMQSWMRNYMLYFNVPVKYGKAQPLDAVVHTPTGPTCMGDLSVGDVVCGAGTKTAVTGVYPQGKLDVYKLTFCDGSTTRASGEHLWEVIIDSKSRVVTTQDLLELPKWRIEKRQVAIPVDKAEFESQTTLLDPYLLGVIIGDGCLTSNMVRLSNPDSEVIERVREALPEGYVMESPPSWADIDYAIKAENFSDAKRDGNAVRNALDELGLMGHNSLDKFIPESYKRNSEVVRMELMRGLLDTDGTVNRVGQPIFNTSSSQLAKDVQELAESLGASVLCNEKRTASGNTGYELNIRVHDARQWFHLSRKRDKASPRKKPLKRTIKSIEHDGQEECQCISVDDPRSLYMTDRFILTHNTVFSPTTMARNFLSASMFTVMNGHFNYSHVLKAGSHTWADLGSSNPAKLDYLRRMVRLGVLHDNPRARELREALDEALDMNALEGSLPARGVKTILNTATKMYRAGDDFWKIIGFENTKADLMRAGMPEAEAEVMAADRVRNGYPTYSMVPGAIRGLRRFPVVGTFVSFPWEIMRNTRHQFRFLREDWNAGRYAMVGKRGVGMAIAGSIAHGISMATMAYFGLDDEDDEAIRQMAPEWQQNARLAYLPPNEDGQMRYLDLSHLDPYTYLKIPFNALANGNYESLDEAAIAGMQEFLEPFLGSEIGFKALGQVWFNSTEYGPVYDENAHWSIRGKQIVWDHLRKELQPGLFSNVERTIKAWKDIYTSYGKKYELSDELLAWGGLRISTMAPEISLRFRSFEFNDQKSGANRPTYRAFRDPNIGAYEDIPGAVEQSKAQWREAFKGMHASIRAARKIGMDDGEIVMALKEGDVAGKYIGPLMGGHVPPWRPYEPTLSNARASLLKTRDDPAEKKALMQDFQKRRELLYQSLSQ